MKEVRRMRGRKKKKKRKGEEREGWIKRSWWRVWGGKGCKQRIKRGTDCEGGGREEAGLPYAPRLSRGGREPWKATTIDTLLCVHCELNSLPPPTPLSVYFYLLSLFFFFFLSLFLPLFFFPPSLLPFFLVRSLGKRIFRENRKNATETRPR